MNHAIIQRLAVTYEWYAVKKKKYVNYEEYVKYVKYVKYVHGRPSRWWSEKS